jgi:hypothetical protein
MQHIDDGTLHEYLDRGGDLDASQSAVTMHIAGCASCRARLDDARIIRARSDSILRSASPVPRATPSFESLVARSAAQRQPADVVSGAQHARPRRAGLGGVPRLAWAATIVLALGAGWMANSLYRSGALDETGNAVILEGGRVAPPDATIQSGTPDAAPQSQTSPAEREAAPAATAPVTPAPLPRATGDAVNDAAPASTGGGVATQGFGTAGAADARREAAPERLARPTEQAARAAPAAQKAAAPNAPRNAPQDTTQGLPTNALAQLDVATGGVSARMGGVAPPPAAPPPSGSNVEMSAAAAATDPARAAALLLDSAEWKTITPAEASVALRGGLASANGQAVIDIGLAEGTPSSPLRVRVRQHLDTGDTVQIIQFAVPESYIERNAVFEVLAQDRQGAIMYRLLRNNGRLLMVAGRNLPAVERATGLLRVGMPQQ